MSSCAAATNLALNKSYSVSIQHNYRLTAPATDKTSLTDGKYTSGHFWTQKSTVGWQGIKNLEIMIDLEKISTIDSLSFSTARGTRGDVHFPSHIVVFTGPDKEHLLYVGDIAKDSDSHPVAYETKRLPLNRIGARGRYVLLEIEVKGYYLFCDEIEVLEGEHNSGRTGNLSINDARKLAQQIVRLDNEKNILANLLGQLQKSLGSQLTDRVVKHKEEISNMQDAEAFEAEILKLRGAALRSQFPGRQILVKNISPWGPLSPVSLSAGRSSDVISLTIPRGGYENTALLITNLSAGFRQISLSLDRLHEKAPELSLYEAPFIKNAAMQYVPDPLVPVKGGFDLRSGESRMIFLTARGRRPGTWQSRLKVGSGDGVTYVPVNIRVANVALPPSLVLNSVNWSYLDFKLIKDRDEAAVKDLAIHHTSILVVPPTHIPMASPDKTLDFSNFKRYLKLHEKVKKVLLFMDYRQEHVRTFGSSCKFLDERWKAAFRNWYNGLMKAADEVEIKRKQIYLYPYDEMHDEEIGQFISFGRWAKKEIPGIQLYATLSVKESLRALPYLDIAQFINDETILNRIGNYAGEKWIYDCKGPAKSLSPYGYYRLMAWKAYLRGYTGIGFWAYADAGWGDNPGTAWDDFDGKNPDYAVIYEGPNNTIISSRRWEAWRMGIEDYELLAMYSKAKGEGVAKALAKSVLDNPQDTTKADEVRRRILLELSQ